MFDKLIDLIIHFGERLNPIIFILEYKEGVLFRAGRFVKILYPGWHFKIPFIDSFHTENVKLDTMSVKEVNITTLDGKTATIGCEFDIEITDFYQASVLTNEWRTNLFDISRGILSNDLEDINWDDIRKKTTKNSIARKIEKRALELGITVSNFNFTDKSISRTINLFNT